MSGRCQLRTLEQQLTFLVSGLAFVIGVACSYGVPESFATADGECDVIPADLSEEMGETGDALDVEDELNDWLQQGIVGDLHPARRRGSVGHVPADRLPPSPFLDPLLRPPCFA
jgi:hypothetical protein